MKFCSIYTVYKNFITSTLLQIIEKGTKFMSYHKQSKHMLSLLGASQLQCFHFFIHPF